jgi:integrase-like protein
MDPRRGTCFALSSVRGPQRSNLHHRLKYGDTWWRSEGCSILALQKPNIDLARGTLQVRRALILNNSSVGTPKSKNSRRTIRLPKVALDALAKHMQKNGEGIWVFPSKSGTNLRYHSFIRFQWKPLVERAGVAYKSFHPDRHFVASELIGRSIPISAVARYLGDNEVTLLRTCSHMIKGMDTHGSVGNGRGSRIALSRPRSRPERFGGRC